MSAPRFADIRAPCPAVPARDPFERALPRPFDRAVRPARHPLRAGAGVRAGRPTTGRPFPTDTLKGETSHASVRFQDLQRRGVRQVSGARAPRQAGQAARSRRAAPPPRPARAAGRSRGRQLHYRAHARPHRRRTPQLRRRDRPHRRLHPHLRPVHGGRGPHEGLGGEGLCRRHHRRGLHGQRGHAGGRVLGRRGRGHAACHPQGRVCHDRRGQRRVR